MPASQRAKIAESVRARWQDPEFHARAAAGIRRARIGGHQIRPLRVPPSRDGWAPACMAASEFDLWRSAAVGLALADRPCDDCPATFELARRTEGRCNRE